MFRFLGRIWLRRFAKYSHTPPTQFIREVGRIFKDIDMFILWLQILDKVSTSHLFTWYLQFKWIYLEALSGEFFPQTWDVNKSFNKNLPSKKPTLGFATHIRPHRRKEAPRWVSLPSRLPGLRQPQVLPWRKQRCSPLQEAYPILRVDPGQNHVPITK